MDFSDADSSLNSNGITIPSVTSRLNPFGVNVLSADLRLNFSDITVAPETDVSNIYKFHYSSDFSKGYALIGFVDGLNNPDMCLEPLETGLSSKGYSVVRQAHPEIKNLYVLSFKLGGVLND